MKKAYKRYKMLLSVLDFLKLSISHLSIEVCTITYKRISELDEWSEHVVAKRTSLAFAANFEIYRKYRLFDVKWAGDTPTISSPERWAIWSLTFGATKYLPIKSSNISRYSGEKVSRWLTHLKLDMHGNKIKTSNKINAWRIPLHCWYLNGWHMLLKFSRVSYYYLLWQDCRWT